MVLHHDAGDFKGVIGINCILHALTVTSMNSLWGYGGSMFHKLTNDYFIIFVPGCTQGFTLIHFIWLQWNKSLESIFYHEAKFGMMGILQ